MREEKYGTITEKSRTDILRELKPSFKKKKSEVLHAMNQKLKQILCWPI